MGSMTARIQMTVEERHEYEEWRDRRAPYNDGSSLHRAFLIGYRGGSVNLVLGPAQLRAYYDGQVARKRYDRAEKISTQCRSCEHVGEFRQIEPEYDAHVEVRCPECGDTQYERVAD